MRLARVPFAASLALAALVAGCQYAVRVGDHDAGRPTGCTTDTDCTPGNQCVCGHCITLDLPAPACNPPCEAANDGDYCDAPGVSCDRGDCVRMTCTGGLWRIAMGTCDAGMPNDAGSCECPPPPPGCRYVGMPCPCDAIECDVVRCGREVCTGGDVCCNASCGICTPPGGVCTDTECAPDCSPMDAVGSGECDGFFGYAWNGGDCTPITGCECLGGDCQRLFTTADECTSTLSGCLRTCGGFAGLSCSAMEWCDFGPEPLWCGGADSSGVCRPRPSGCLPSYDVCGCDGVTYPSPCHAAEAGHDFAHEGACGDCAPEDARSSGMCASIVGWAWTGSDCTPISCACEGTDCGLVTSRDEALCRRAHAECAGLLGP